MEGQNHPSLSVPGKREEGMDGAVGKQRELGIVGGEAHAVLEGGRRGEGERRE